MKKETLYKFFEGHATLEEEMTVRAWMESSEGNTKEFFRERQLFDASVVLAEPEPIKISEIPAKQFSILKEILKIASVALLTLSIGTVYQTHKSANEPIAMQSITIPAGQYIKMSLSDGTIVWLNARTTLTYPANFNTKQRTVELNGEAYFEVAKKEDCPFIVKTHKYNVEVLGTQFNIEAYKDKGDFTATLMQGKVRILSAEDPEVSLILNPDTKAVCENGKLIVQNIDDYTHYRWREGLICFKDESFADIMGDFEKYYGVTIHINNSNVSKYSYTGKFRQTDGVDYALRILQRDIDFKYRKDDEIHEITIE